MAVAAKKKSSSVIRTARYVRQTEGQIELIGDLPEGGKPGAKKVLQDLRERDKVTVVSPNYKLVTTLEQLRDVADAMRQGGIASIDTETRGKIWWKPNNKVVSINIYTPSTSKAYFIPVRMVHAMRNFEDHEIADILGPVLTDPGVKKIGQNFKYDLHMIRETFDIEIEGLYFDTLLAGIILDENADHDLESMTVTYLHGKRWKHSHVAAFETHPMKIAQQYACRDAEMTYKLYEFQNKHLEAREKLHSLMFDVEMPTVIEAYGMEKQGVAYDFKYHEEEMIPLITGLEKEAEDKVREQIGTDVNLNAAQQVANAFFEMLGLPRIDGDHVAEAQLTTLAKQGYKIAQHMLDFRKWSTINKMFVRKLPTWAINGRIHCSFNTIGADTGRMSCRQPNLQQLPKRIGPTIRRAIIPSPGHVFVTMDFSQIELRLLAHFSEDEGLIQAFKDDIDIHTAVMCRMLGVDPAEYEADKDRTEFVAKRVLAKTVNFGVLYGMGPTKLGWKTGITMEVAQEFIQQYFAAYPGIKRFINRMKNQAYKDGYVETILGRKRRLPDCRSLDKAIAAMAERLAVNAPIQGSAADLAKVAMLQHSEIIRKNHWPYKLLLQIHDELIYEVPLAWLEHHGQSLVVLKDAMEHCIPLRVPIKVSQEILSRWGDKQEVETDDFDMEDLAA